MRARPGGELVVIRAWLGAPYAQADYASIGPELEGKTEMDALIAYLQGLGVEVMASSDNVLRGGLTPKFVDVPELLRTIDFRPVAVPMLAAEKTVLDQEIFRPPFAEFQLQRIELGPDDGPVPLAQSGAAVIIVVAGSVYLDSPKGDLHLSRGASAFLAAAEAPVNVHRVAGSTEPALAFAVTTGL